MHPALNIMIKAARRASQIINRASQDLEHVKVAAKQQSDFVTEVDKAAEAAIINVLREAYPDYGILAEESGLTAGNGAGNDYQWIIDPLDGTTNFIHGFPQYSVSIALAYKGQPNQAVVYDTVRNEMFTASKGGGAFLNERRIRVAAKRTKLDTALLGTGFPYRMFPHIDAYLGMYKDFTQRSTGIRRAGSAALDLAYVACGRLDGFWKSASSPGMRRPEACSSAKPAASSAIFRVPTTTSKPATSSPAAPRSSPRCCKSSKRTGPRHSPLNSGLPQKPRRPAGLFVSALIAEARCRPLSN